MKYFRHDADPTSDPAMLELLAKFGFLGYGYFWRLVEMMRSEGTDKKYALSTKSISGYALALMTSKKKVSEFISWCIKAKLFSSDKELFWSDRLVRDMEFMEMNSQDMSARGKEGAKARWKKEDSTAIPQAKQRQKPSHANNTIKEDTIQYDKVYELWNSQNIITHMKLSDLIRTGIDKALKQWSIEEIEKAIRNYGTVINGKQYYFNYKWSLYEFLTRKNAIVKFVDDACLTNFLDKKYQHQVPSHLKTSGGKYD